MSKVQAIPDNYTRVTPYICVQDADAAIQFYVEVFGAEERMRIEMGEGVIGHAEIVLGDSVIMLSSPFPDMNVHDPEHYGGSPVNLSLYVEDVDATFAKAIEHGAKEVDAITDQFWGDRSGKLLDPWGHVWSLATHIEDVSPEEMEKRAAAAFG